MPSLVADQRIAVALDETSDVVALPDGTFLVVSDTEPRAALVRAGSVAYLDLPGVSDGDSGLEAVAFDPATGRLVSYAEERAELLVHRWDGTASSPAVLASRHAFRFGKKKNKGVEGIAFFGAKLLCANEAKPRGLFVVDLGLDDVTEVALDEAILAACDDFSGLAYDARRGTHLLVSDESAALVELALEERSGGVAGRLRAAHALVDERGEPLERVEGVAVDPSGAWWVLLENERVLCRVRAAG